MKNANIGIIIPIIETTNCIAVFILIAVVDKFVNLMNKSGPQYAHELITNIIGPNNLFLLINIILIIIINNKPISKLTFNGITVNSIPIVNVNTTTNLNINNKTDNIIIK